MKTLLTLLGCISMYLLQAQETITKTYPVKNGQQLELSFDYPKIVKLSTWDKNEVAIIASVSINGGENNDAFQLIESTQGSTLSIKNIIKDMKNLPKRYTAMADGKKTVFTSKETFEQFKSEGKNVKYYSEGVDMEITIEVKVPQSMVATLVKATYGVVELVDFNSPLQVDATYGGIDASINTQQVGKLNLVTHFGHIYTNLDLNIVDKNEKDFYTSITSAGGKGPDYSFKSTYGNLYLRKPSK